jgi:transposase
MVKKASRHPAATNIAPRQIDDYRESFEQQDARLFPERIRRGRLALQRLYYKAFAETKPACWPAKTKGDSRKTVEQELAKPEFAAWVGIDWADKKHAFSLQACGASKIERGELEQRPEAIEQFACELARRFPDRLVAVALEQSRGALLFMLSKYAHLGLFPVHPNTLDHYRKSFYPSGAKSDPKDADLILDLLQRHPERLRRLQPDTVETRTLQFLVEARRESVDEQTRYRNRLTAQLKMYFPQLLDWFEETGSAVLGNLLLQWPTLEQLQQVEPTALEQFFRRYRLSGSRIRQLQKAIQAAVPAIHDQAILQTSVLIVKRLVQQLAVLREAIAEHDKCLQEWSHSHPDYPIFASFPSAGPVMAPRLIAALGSQRDRYATASQIQCYAGIAPVVEASGKQRWVHWRWSCPKFLRQSFHEWAWLSARKSEWARAYYDQQRSKGKSHHAAVRALAFKWLRILFRCWKDSRPYDEEQYQRSLQKRAKPTPAPSVQIHWKTVAGFSKLDAISS